MLNGAPEAIELNPDYSVPRVWYALQLGMEGRFIESLREAYIARDLDPLAVISRFSVAWCLYHARRYDEAHRLCRDTLDAEPQNMMMLYAVSFALSRLGRHDEAIAAATKGVELWAKQVTHSEDSAPPMRLRETLPQPRPS